LPLLDAGGAEIAFTVVTLLALHDDAVAEGALEGLHKRRTAEERSAFKKAARVDSL